MLKKIIHIPHFSNYIPKKYISDYIISNQDIVKECNIMQDTFTDKLISGKNNGINIIKFNYSRIFCDVERFNDDKEIMNDVGMGVLYTMSHNLKKIRKIKNKKNILTYYNNHHNKLNKKTTELLKNNDKILIIDLHSYSNKPLKYELNKKLNRPDICVGIDDYHKDEKIVNEILYIIKSFGLTYSINEPFSGCLIPSKYYHKNDKVKGIMLEINKNILYEDIKKIKELLKCIIKI